MKPRLTLVALGLIALAMISLGLQAQDQPKATTQEKDEITTSEQQLMRQFGEFQDSLLKLKQRLARGTPEERKRAEALGAVLDECKNLAINQEFLGMIELLRTVKLNNLNDIKIAEEKSNAIAEKLRKVLNMLQDSNKSNLSDEVAQLRAILAKLGQEIDKQKFTEHVLDRGKTNPEEVERLQKNNTTGTEKVKKDIEAFLKGKDGKDGKPGEAKNEKGETKPGGKNDGKSGEAKNDGKKPSEGAKGEAKNDGAKDPKESKGGQGEAKPQEKPGQPKSGGDGEPKAGSKPSDPKGGEGAPSPSSKKNDGGDKADQGPAKKNDGGDKGEKKPGDAKDAGNKDPDPKKDGPQGSAKGDDKKPGGEGSKQKSPDSQAKPGGGEGKAGGGPEPKMVANKEADGAGKAGEGKGGGEGKAGKGAQGETKPGASKSGQGQAKEGGASPEAGGSPSPPPASAKGDSPPPPPPGGSPPPSKKDDDLAQTAKKLQEAGYDQKSAENAIPKDQTKIALKNQADAIQKMEEARKKLEKLLQQMREQEIERVLAALLARCEKMLALQQQVLLGTVDTDAAIKRTADGKPTRDHRIESLKLSDKEKEIVQEANKCIDILEAEGTAVAFPESFQQLRTDMMHVQKRLEITDVQDLTQDLEKDIIVQLKDMIDALKKAQEKQDPDAGKSGKSGKSGPPPDPKLLELVQELKMIRALQKRVNDRTTVFGKKIEGEQAADQQVVRELRILADRQQRIQEIVRRIANGDNK
jgi:hypothetical protein